MILKKMVYSILRLEFMKYFRTTGEKDEQGFSYLDVIVAIVILMIGVLALASALSANLVRSLESEKRIVSKQMALSTIESIVSARDIQRTGVIEGWDAIGSVGTNPVDGVPRGIFLTGWTPVREDLGADGVAGTADDSCAGTGGCPGTPPNTSSPLPDYERQIIIEDVEDPERPTPPNEIARRKISVKIRFNVNANSREETISTMVAKY